MRVLIVYYSRTGVTKKACETIAGAMKAVDESVEVQLEEIVDRTDRAGVLGYARGGKDAMLKHSTEIEPVQADVGSFDLVVIGTPVWAFTCAPAARAFCEQFADELDTVAFVATMGGSGDEGAFKALQEYCGAEPLETLSLREREVKNEHPVNYVVPLEAFAEETVESSMQRLEGDSEVISGDAMWTVRLLNGETVGPLTDYELAKRFSEGDVQADSLVRCPDQAITRVRDALGEEAYAAAMGVRQEREAARREQKEREREQNLNRAKRGLREAWQEFNSAGDRMPKPFCCGCGCGTITTVTVCLTAFLAITLT